MIYACKYGKCYYNNEDYFKQFLGLRQGDLTVAKYEDKFARQQYISQPVEDEAYDLISFHIGLHKNLLTNVIGQLRSTT